MIAVLPRRIDRKTYHGLGIYLEDYEHYFLIGMDYSELDERGRGTAPAQEVYLWGEDQGYTWERSPRFDNIAFLTPAEAMAFKLRWF
jgi:hypothetical protein